MFIRSRTMGFVVLGLILMSGSAWASPTTIEGIVKDPKGQAIKGADVRIEAKDGSGWNKVVKTGAKGQYICNALPKGGNYRVTLLVDGTVKASINNVLAKIGDSNRLNFDLKATSASGKKSKHMVWIPAQTGSNLGGRWVEADGGAAAAAEAYNLKVGGAGTIKAIQAGSGNARGGGE